MSLPPPVLRLQDSARQQNFAEDFLPFLAGYYRQADFADLASYSPCRRQSRGARFAHW